MNIEKAAGHISAQGRTGPVSTGLGKKRHRNPIVGVVGNAGS